MFDGGEFFPSSSECCSFNSSSSSSNSKKRKIKNKNRFSDDQIKSLETMFESETKLEPKKKLEIARELGLQPRQVAIWFQNKRARFKSKQLERDYEIFMSNYNNLASQFESLKKEKQSLLMQLQQLNDQLKKSQKDEKHCKQEICEIEMDNRGNVKKEMDEKPRLSFDISEHGFGVISDDDIEYSSIIKADYLGLDEDSDLLNMVEPADGILTSPENWGTLENDTLLDQPSTDWWDFWS